ncbi:hypothetical protein TRAPUB_7434 [Trametes pubescens]|uniref:Uncharacterized protein n=1 Tax=Trametes pubescens TaxID=154538 RepID=A0A1M2V3C5_TRAPU|nr:hypothetical protein TRAPUB_7434 [Trametes pubescens]
MAVVAKLGADSADNGWRSSAVMGSPGPGSSWSTRVGSASSRGYARTMSRTSLGVIANGTEKRDEIFKVRSLRHAYSGENQA